MTGARSTVILDNLNTHKPKRDRWLARHPNVRFHFTPTHASWLNQVECWFSILAGQPLQGASFTGVAELRRHIDAFVASHNQSPRPFAWTKSEIHQKPQTAFRGPVIPGTRLPPYRPQSAVRSLENRLLTGDVVLPQETRGLVSRCG